MVSCFHSSGKCYKTRKKSTFNLWIVVNRKNAKMYIYIHIYYQTCSLLIRVSHLFGIMPSSEPMLLCYHYNIILRADSRFAPSQWEMALLCNDVSHWLGANLESTLILVEKTLTESELKYKNVFQENITNKMIANRDLWWINNPSNWNHLTLVISLGDKRSIWLCTYK